MTRFARAVSIGAYLFLLPLLLLAQDRSLELGDAIEAELAPGETHRYILSARELTLASFRVNALDESLDPMIEISDSAGRSLISNDDYDYPASRDALIQALVFPDTDDYRLSVSGVGDSAGRYRLTALPGFDTLAATDGDLSPSDWHLVNGSAEVDASGTGGLSARMEGMARLAELHAAALSPLRDFYFELAFQRVSGANGWRAGIIFRYVDADNYARLLLNQRGFWRVERVAAGRVRTLRDWTTHPAIVPGESDFRLGLLASGRHLDIVYNGLAIGRAADSLAQAGGFGVSLRTADVFGSRLTLAFASPILTTPSRTESGALPRQSLASARQSAVANALLRQQLIPVNGEVRLTLPESNVRHRSAGVTPFVFGAGVELSQFVIGARLRYELGESANGGCGLLFHYADAEHYQLAYLTRGGDMGISRREGARFAPGLYVKRAPGERQERDLLLIAANESLILYVDGAFVGSMSAPSASGRIGIAVVNYERVDTNCIFEDLWALSFDA